MSVYLLLSDEIRGREGCPISFLWDAQLLLPGCSLEELDMVLALSPMLSHVYVGVGVWGCFAAWTPVPPLGHDGVHFVLPPHPDHLLFHLSPWQEEIPDRRRKAEVGLTPTLLLLPRDWPPSQRLCCCLQQRPQSKS